MEVADKLARYRRENIARRKRKDRVSPGPWGYIPHTDGDTCEIRTGNHEPLFFVDGAIVRCAYGDADFIVWARVDNPEFVIDDLLNELEFMGRILVEVCESKQE